MNSLRLIFLLLLFSCCNGTDKASERKFVDLKAYFNNEVKRLTQHSIKVDKTVSRNGISESKKNIAPNWETELSLFSESDINKPAWTNSFKVREESGIISYKAIDSTPRTRSVVIHKDSSGKIIELSVVNSTSNYLYNSSEELRYIPDSLYQIVKKQDVLLLGNNNYKIFGNFK